jgi:PAS domain S-box-containing protein
VLDVLAEKIFNKNGLSDQRPIEKLMSELQEERDVLDSIMENTNTQLAYLDTQFNFLRVNSAYVKGSGKNRDELIGKNHFDLFPNTENQKLFESVRDSGQSIEYHAKPFKYKDQPERDITYWDWSLSPVKDKEGNVQGLVLSLKDVTDIQRKYTDAKYSVVKLLGLITGSIFVTEAIIMGIFHLIPEYAPLTYALFDAGILTLFVFPLLYFLLVKPLTANIAKRNYAEQELQKAYDKMKVAVNERTNDLNIANRKLKLEIEDHRQTEIKLEHELVKSKQREKEVVTLLNSAKVVLEVDDFNTISKQICEYCRKIIGASQGFIALVSDNKYQYEVKFAHQRGAQPSDLAEKKIALSGLSDLVYRTNEAAYDNDFLSNTQNKFLSQGSKQPQNALFAPLNIYNEVVGFIGLANKKGGFSDDDIRLIATFGELIAIALSQSWAMELLENSEARFRSVAETANEAIINVDQFGQITFWNRAAYDIFGYSIDEIIKKPLTLLMPAQYQKDHLNGIKNVIVNGRSKLVGKIVELTGLRKNGEEFPLELSLSTWEMGEKLYFTGIIRDISKRKKIEKELLDAKDSLEKKVKERTAELVTMNEKLRQEILGREKIEEQIEMERKRLFSVLDRLPASVHLIKPDHTILFANRYFRQQFGDQTKRPCHKILHGLDVPCSICNAFEVFSTGIPDEHEEKHSDGKLYRVYNYPFTDTDGSSLILQLGIDITAHKKAEEDLRKSEERFRILVNSIDDTVFTLDRKKRFLEIYGNLFNRLGISTQKSLNKSMKQVFDIEKNKNHDQAINKALKGESVIYEWTDSKEDETRFIQNSISPIFDESGNADGVVGVARDITEQKRLARLQVETEKLMTVAEMSAMISHEFRNSLTSVRMILELQYESDNLNSAEKRSLSVALSSLKHMEDIVTQLLNFSRPKPMEFKLGDLNSLILECLDFTRPQYEKKKIEIYYELDKSLPLINIDKNYLKEAVINIILNAIQAIPVIEKNHRPGRIDIRTEKHFLIKTIRDVAVTSVSDLNTNSRHLPGKSELIMAHGDSCALITIRDSGIGIKAEDMRRIFNPFYTTTIHGGTGLGLSTVKRTINAHKGIIRVESEWGKGTIFKIYLPITIE